jgi:hypothetical protein
VIHQNLIIMKPILIIDDARAVALLRRLLALVDFPVPSRLSSYSPESIRASLALILDSLSKSEDNETDRA